MRTGRADRWLRLLLLAGFLMLLAPCWAQPELPIEKVLNGVTLNSTYVEVLARLGMPHFIGPSVPGLSSVTDLLRPAVMQPGQSTPAAGMSIYDSSTPATNQPAPGAAQQQNGPYMIWRYDGSERKPDLKPNVTTYVFFNDQGVVEAVVVNLNNLKSTSKIRTESGVTFGTKMSDLVKKYGWPDPFSRINTLYYCSYPDNNVTFSLDTSEIFSRRVKCIAIGLPIALVSQTSMTGTDVVSVQPQTKDGDAPLTLLPTLPSGGERPVAPTVVTPVSPYVPPTVPGVDPATIPADTNNAMPGRPGRDD